MNQLSEHSLLRPADIYSTQEHRGILPVARSTFYKWVKEGRISAGKKVGGTTLWSYQEIKSLAQPQ